ncbi:MAG: hypothetical protein NXI31_10575 [bacterium]|nr:hypothetical protein [bacterium]
MFSHSQRQTPPRRSPNGEVREVARFDAPNGTRSGAATGSSWRAFAHRTGQYGIGPKRIGVAALGFALTALAGLGTNAVAQAPIPGASQIDAVHRLVANDTARWLHHEDPIVRGEAALVVATASRVHHHRRLLEIARDRHPEARRRGLLALGFQATAGVAIELEEILASQSRRTELDGLCAAFALGSLPPEHAPGVTSRVLTSFADSNWKRQGPVLTAMLCGLARHEDHGQGAALEQLFDVRANRDPELRALLLELILATSTPDQETTLERLDQSSTAERLALLRWLASTTTKFDAALVKPIARIQRKAPQAEVRAAALAVLSRLRHPPAIELAVSALRSRHAVEVEQGMRSALSIGGSSMRLALDRHVRETESPRLKAAMLRSWAAPPTRELLDQCAKLATDREQPLELRVAAATTLSRADQRRASPVLRDLVRSTNQNDYLRTLSRTLVAHASPLPPLSRLLPEPAALTGLGGHWCALLAASHPEAMRRLLQTLANPKTETAALQTALVAWRRAMVLDQLPAGGSNLPAPLRELLLPRL